MKNQQPLFGYESDKPIAEHLDSPESVENLYTELLANGYETIGDDRDTLTSALGKLYRFMTGKEIEKKGTLNKENKKPVTEPYNLIFFGAPGTGKSYTMNQWVLGEDVENLPHPIKVAHAERVTFYADYLHAQFFGSYKPTMAKDENGHRVIEYAFKPGPFLRVLIWALKHPNERAVLVIEELNRAEAASVFGDLFQLLDRNDKGISQYPIAVSEEVKDYLRKALETDGCRELAKLLEELKATNPDSNPQNEEGTPGGDPRGGKDAQNNKKGTGPDKPEPTDPNKPEPTDRDEVDSIVVPPNMFIWATMNSADQGVFPLDTAFKRRWSFKYFPIDEGENDSEWNKLRKAINEKLLEVGINEDKCMGPYFLGTDSGVGSDEFNEAIKNKVIMYLFEDAARYHRADIFKQGNTSLSQLFAAWDKTDEAQDEKTQDENGKSPDKGDKFSTRVVEVFSNDVVRRFNQDGNGQPVKRSDKPSGGGPTEPDEDDNKQEPDTVNMEQNQDQTADNE